MARRLEDVLPLLSQFSIDSMAMWIGVLPVVGVALVIFCSDFFCMAGLVSSFLAAAVVGSVSVFSVFIAVSPKHFSSVQIPTSVVHFQGTVQKGVKEDNLLDQKTFLSKVIMSRSVSTALQNLIDLVFRDLLEALLKDLTLPGTNYTAHLKNDVWEALHELYLKLSHIDPLQFISQDVVSLVTRHMEKIRLSQQNQDNKEKPYVLSSFLASPQRELEFLRKLADVIVLLFPRSYRDCLPLRHLLREFLACQILQPGISIICDPDTINQQLVLQLRVRQMMKRNYAYAASYEDFVLLIEDCEDLNELQQIRYNIVTEIAQATAMSTVKRSKGLEIEEEFTPQSTSKGDLLQARNLKRYIKQLTYAKIQCERRLRSLGMQVSEPGRLATTGTSHFVEDMVPSFKAVMRNPRLRKELESYLEQQGESQVSLLKFWIGTQELRRLDRKSALTSAAKMFYSYFHGTNPTIKLDKAVVKGMESFLLGDRGPDCFFQAQDQVWRILEERHYPSFLVVLTCRMTGRQAHQNESDCTTDLVKERAFSWKGLSSSEDSDDKGVVEWSEQTQLAKSRIEQLDSRLDVKLQALSNLRSIAPEDNSLVPVLEREIEGLQRERREVESWQDQAETWATHIGHWKAIVNIPQNPDDKECVRFPVHIRLEDDEALGSSASKTVPVSRNRAAMSWTVWRQVAEFYALHSKLRQQCSWLKSAQLPAVSGKTLFGKPNDRIYLERAQEKLQNFLDTVMADDKLNKSEALFTFLHNTPSCLRPSVNAPKKSRFFLATFFKGDAPRDGEDDIDHDNVVIGDDTDAFQSSVSDDTRDGIAEPLYHLISEVFELRGVFGWLRRTLVTFVQITYGRTINKQLREVVSSLFTDQAVIGYVQLIVKTWWPEGSFLPPSPARHLHDKIKTKLEARELLIANVPEVLCQLLGQQNARRGVLRALNALQDDRLNKQLFYDLLEVILKDAFPELTFR